MNLARGAYGAPALLLLDDPLSALDSHTGRAVFARLLGEAGLLRASAVVLATHATQYLAQATRVCVLDHGRQALYGTHSEMVRAPLSSRPACTRAPLGSALIPGWHGR